ncbi:MAG: glycosyltransferase [Fimbriimonadaceae bacterium]|nr:glycosyltransferase [Fimbriimonadaceae bacterium]
MRLAVLAGLDSPWSYGAMEAIAKAGVEVHAFQVAGKGYVDTQAPAWQERISNFERVIATRTEVRGVGFLKYFQLGNWLNQHFRTLRPDAVLSLYAGGLGLAAIRARAPKVVLYAVGSDILSVKPPAGWITRRNLTQADLVVTNGEYLAERTKALAPKANVRNLLLGIDTKRYVPGHGDPTVSSFVCTRGFSPVYNNMMILRALARLPKDLPHWSFKFVAGGPLLEDHREWARVNMDQETYQRVTFLGGLASDGVLRALQESDYFVSMSKSDGTATSVLEALSCGLTPILSDIPANRPWSQHLVAVDDITRLALVMERMIREPRTGTFPEARDLVVRTADAATNMRQLVNWIGAL